MKNKIRLKACVFSLVFMLTACNQTIVKENEEQQPQDMFEVETLANKAYENDDWVESEKYYIILVKEIPENALHWFRLGNIYARTNRPDAAVSAYRESLIRDPKYAKAWYNLGVLHLKQAANSFSEFEQYVDENDPLYGKGQKIFVETLKIIQGDKGN